MSYDEFETLTGRAYGNGICGIFAYNGHWEANSINVRGVRIVSQESRIDALLESRAEQPVRVNWCIVFPD